MRKQTYDAEYKHQYYLKNKEKMRAFQQARYNADPETWKLAVRKQRLRKIYFPHMSVEAAWNTYQEMIQNQNNCCAVCGKPETKIDPQRKRLCMLAIDHCHLTNKIRGLLCFRCNTNLGWFEAMQDKFLKYLGPK